MRVSKILIVGIVASGKTTLARQLSERTGIPWHELDDIVYRRGENRSKRSPEEQAEQIRVIDRQGAWIMEGVDRSSYSQLYELADQVLFLDPPLWKRKMRIVTRYLKQKTGLEDSHYPPDLHMLKMMFRWTRDFERGRPQFEAKLANYGNKVLRVEGHEEARRVLRIGGESYDAERPGSASADRTRRP